MPPWVPTAAGLLSSHQSHKHAQVSGGRPKDPRGVTRGQPDGRQVQAGGEGDVSLKRTGAEQHRDRDTRCEGGSNPWGPAWNFLGMREGFPQVVLGAVGTFWVEGTERIPPKGWGAGHCNSRHCVAGLMEPGPLGENSLSCVGACGSVTAPMGRLLCGSSGQRDRGGPCPHLGGPSSLPSRTHPLGLRGGLCQLCPKLPKPVSAGSACGDQNAA